MASVTQRINAIKQPRGGYLNPKDFETIQLITEESLNEKENIAPGLVGLVVDYMTRYMMNGDVRKAFAISRRGAALIGQSTGCAELLSSIHGLDDASLTAAARAAGYDVCFRVGLSAFRPVDLIMPDRDTLENIRIMVKRSLRFFEIYGPVTVDGFTFQGGYTSTVDTGDGDFLTEDTLWDFKVSKKDPTNKHTLQLLMYYLMGLRSIYPYFQAIRWIGIYNPRLHRVYRYELSNLPVETINEIETNVIGY